MSTQVIAQNERDLQQVGEKLLGQHPQAKIFAFYGQMGAGKTTFIKTLGRILQTTDNISSPTFSLINEYHTSSGCRIFHFDFYRIKKIEEAFDLGYEDYFYSGEYCLIEWPELIEPLLPGQTVKVKITVDESNQSRIFRF